MMYHSNDNCIFVLRFGDSSMEFCPTCDKRLVQTMPTQYSCTQCGYTQLVKERIPPAPSPQKDMTNPVTIPLESNHYALPTITITCLNCDNSTAYYKTNAIGKDDDISVIRNYTCTKCGYQWKHNE
jgi:DNA-directed RNA polymerase subunit M/transcription elongation factor TFIIS